MNPAFAKAIDHWSKTIGTENVITDQERLAAYEANTIGIEREIPVVLKPSTTEEVQAIVKIANTQRIPLYPVSGGKNWGYGSRVPSKDGTAVVDLAHMNRIRNASELSPHSPFLVLEPGVTQRQLFEYLQNNNLPYRFNVTAAGNQTSIIGNGLDRGVGYWNSRAEDLSCLEVVLGTGEVITTGYGHYPDAKAKYHYKYGVGPWLDGLFYQSNFGIVTSAAFRLIPEPEYMGAVLVNVQQDETLEDLLEAMRELRFKGVFHSVMHIGNKERIISALAPRLYKLLVESGEPRGNATKEKTEALLAQEKFGPWNAFCGLSGSRKQVLQNYNHIKNRVRKIGSVRLLTPKKIAASQRLLKALNFIPALRRKQLVLEAALPLHLFSSGVPSDEILPSVHWSAGHFDESSTEINNSKSGIIFCNPAIPLEPKSARALVECIKRVFGKFGFAPNITLNIHCPYALICVVNVSFDKGNDMESKGAQRCADDCLTELIKLGFYPYRAGIQVMPTLVNTNDTFWSYVGALKKVFDPNNIIAPGRYSPV
jgi:4-cresol dehydrogenase (hydroxylating)